MPDHNFHHKRDKLSIEDVVNLTGAEPSASRDLFINDVAPLDTAGADDLSFFDNIKYKDKFIASGAGFCFAQSEFADIAPSSMIVLKTREPYKCYALCAQQLYPDDKPESSIAKGSFISQTARIAEGCTIEQGVVIEDNVVIGAHCWIESGCVIKQGVQIGSHTRIGSNAVISHAHIGDHVRVYRGVCIGQDGFGFAIDPSGHVKVPQLGRVIIEDSVEIGANSCIDRGAGPDTVIGQGTFIDNLVQIGHNVKIGKSCVIVAQVGISGSTVIEDYAVLAGQVGIAGHLKVGRGARIAAQSGVMRDVPAGEEHMGSPSMPIKQQMRQIATLARLAKTGKKKSMETGNG
jgi:UDP-3-O-[3-hydroxymyristoyl] glucosamine N-acyltransferase